MAYDKTAFVASRTVAGHPVDDDCYCCSCCMIVTLYHLEGVVDAKYSDDDDEFNDGVLCKHCEKGKIDENVLI